MIDENDFFRKACLAILSTLKIENALLKTLSYLGTMMPADELFLHIYDFGLKAVRTVARADSSGGTTVGGVIPMPFDPSLALKTEQTPYVQVVNRPQEDPATRLMGRALGKPDSSVLVMRLTLEDHRPGTVVLRADGPDAFTGEHARLFALLNEPFGMALSNSLQHDQVLRLSEALADESRYFQRELARRSGETVVGEEFGLRHTMEMVRQVAPLASPVLLLGETGTGKEVIANAIHNLSGRRGGPFIKVNCGALPEGLVDSELFGHEKGAFTGAINRKRGRFERAHEGTLFLDEVGELPPAVQVRLLRVLQTKEFERVGGASPIMVDVRIIAATNRDLASMVGKGSFREDLWYRLNVFPIFLPPLRERKTDIPALVYYLMERKAREMALPGLPQLGPTSMDRLLEYHWPGNVRELDNVIERAIVLGKGEPLHFPDLLAPSEEMPERGREGPDRTFRRLEEVEATHIRDVLAATMGKIHGPGGAAELLGLHPNTLRHRMTKLGIAFGKKIRSCQQKIGRNE
ncbi:MAG TPA: sigma 54-interacting transcriptional regulator [Syntrophorhabdaceae bacterium]|jgi:transcriptional regulator with GAF, ATPase, and Fis domain